MSEQPAWMAFDGGNNNNGSTGGIANNGGVGGGYNPNVANNGGIPGASGNATAAAGGGGAGPAFVPAPYSQVQQAKTQPSVEDGGMMHERTNSTDLTDPTSLRFGDPADDKPLLEELGIHPSHIKAKASSVLHPMRAMDASVVEDTDLAGPLVFAVLLGFLLGLQGKLQFGAVYTVSVLGVVLAKCLLSLMSDQPVKTQFVISTLGYCLLPNILLAAGMTFKYWIWGAGGVMVPVALGVIAWSGWCATQMFVAALDMQEQKWLLLYPSLLFYATFAALTIF